jgi:hypothetical protein
VPAITYHTSTSATGYSEDPVSQDLAWHATNVTGSEIGAILGGAWTSRLQLPAHLMRWEVSNTALPSVIKLILSSDVPLSALHACARAVTQAWNSSSSVPPALRFTPLLNEVSEFSFGIVDRRFEVEATLASPNPATLLPERSSSDPHHAPHAPGSSAEAPPHARLARELRDMTGLSASILGSAFGVSREQYSRWVGGKPISDTRHGQLQFLHTVVRELIRRLGSSEARVWLHRPLDDLVTPVDLLQGRKFDRFYREVIALPDSDSAAVRTKISLTAPLPTPEDVYDQGTPWSPYDQSGDP